MKDSIPQLLFFHYNDKDSSSCGDLFYFRKNQFLYYTIINIHFLWNCKSASSILHNYGRKIKLRDKLVDIALQWQASFGIAPSITSSISEYDAAMLVGMSEKEYSDYMRDKTAVAKGTDFVYRNIRYQVKANRPSGKKEVK